MSILAQSVVWSDHVPLVLKAGVAAVAVLAALRPADALLVVAGLVPFGHVLVTSVSGCLSVRRRRSVRAGAFLPAICGGNGTRCSTRHHQPGAWLFRRGLFALVVLASCVVQYAVLQVWHDYPLTYAAGFVHYLATEYLTAVPDPRPWVDGRGFVWTAALLLEGVALLGCASTLCARQAGLARRLTDVVVVAGAGVAILSLYASRRGRAREPSLPGHGDRKPHAFPGPPSQALTLPDPILRWWRLRRSEWLPHPGRTRCLGSWLPTLTVSGMFLVRTRSAIVASLAIVAAGLAFLGTRRLKWLSGTKSHLSAAFVALALSVGVVLYNPLSHSRGRRSLVSAPASPTCRNGLAHDSHGTFDRRRHRPIRDALPEPRLTRTAPGTTPSTTRTTTFCG